MAARRPVGADVDAARKALGRRGEELVARYLEGQGWVVRARNWRCRGGELDLVVERGEVLAFVEVRTLGRAAAREAPEATVRALKQGRLERAAGQWLARHGAPRRTVRFDVAGVIGDVESGRACVRYFPAAFVPRQLWF